MSRTSEAKRCTRKGCTCDYIHEGGVALYQPALSTSLDAIDLRSGRLLPKPGFLQPWPWWLVPFGVDSYIERTKPDLRNNGVISRREVASEEGRDR